MDEVDQLIQAKRAYLVAPAGCGKTHLIARAVARRKQGRDLILTHTHAGVAALRKKCKELGASTSHHQVETIAGWALKFASAFPKTSRICTCTPRQNHQWNEVYEAATRVISVPPIQEILRCSYAGVYVDEYQDCNYHQHELILKLADVLPCRILGDPLQGIFDFDECIDWEKHVPSNFDALPEMGRYWRWEKSNPKLGLFLKKTRELLQAGKDLDLRKWRAVKWSESSDYLAPSRESLRIAADQNATVVAILRFKPQCHDFMSRLNNMFTCLEPLQCEDLIKTAENLESMQGFARGRTLLDFACACMTQVSTRMRAVIGAIEEDRKPSKRCSCTEQVRAVVNAMEDSSVLALLNAFEKIRLLPGVRFRRDELFFEMLRALREYGSGDYCLSGPV